MRKSFKVYRIEIDKFPPPDTPEWIRLTPFHEGFKKYSKSPDIDKPLHLPISRDESGPFIEFTSLEQAHEFADLFNTIVNLGIRIVDKTRKIVGEYKRNPAKL